MSKVLHSLTECSALPNLLIHPLQIILIPTDDRQGDDFRHGVAAGLCDNALGPSDWIG